MANDTKELLLNHAIRLFNENGSAALNIRALANASGVSVGTVYNNFLNKEDIILSITELHWEKAIREFLKNANTSTFIGFLSELYQFLMENINDDIGNLMFKISPTDGNARMKMMEMQSKFIPIIKDVLVNDGSINEDFYSKCIDINDFIVFILDNLILNLRNKNESIDFFLSLVKDILVIGY
ncbi:MAG: TetR/AcrR family transcriptional regulator [Tissierellia bacterium]|nr:TetR/AcrR family transcriptional regulator [Tissierellia bacterium]